MRGWWLCVACAACGFRPAGAVANAPDGSVPGAPDARRSDAPPADGPPNASDATPADGASSSFGFVQAATDGSQDGSTVEVALPAMETAGDFNVIGVSWSDTSSAITSVTDDDGNTYTEVGAPLVKGGVGQLAIYAAWNIRVQGAMNTVNIATSKPDSSPVAVVAEYRGVVTGSDPVDVMAGKAGMPPGPPDSTMATTTNAHDLIIGIGAADTDLTAGTGFAGRTPAGGDLLEDEIVTSKASYHATATQAPIGMWWLMRMVAVKAAD